MAKVMTSEEFVKRLRKVLNYKTSYMLGSFGHVTNDINIEWEVNRKDVNNKGYEEGARSILNEGFMFDCCGLIKGISWGFNYDLTKQYGGAIYAFNGVSDYDADTIMNICENASTDFSNIEPGEAVWLKGHIGVYLGNGECIESTPRWSVSPGVKITLLANIGYKGNMARSWSKHGKLPWIDYTKKENVVYNKIDEIPSYFREAIEWYVDNGYLKGTGDGLDLDYTTTRILTVLYRILNKE